MRFPSFRSVTRVEFVFFSGLLFLLAVGLFVPLREHIEIAHLNRAVESAHTIDTLLAQYATDNDGIYPVGEGTSAVGTSEGIARNFLQNNYVPDTGVFAVGNTPQYSGTSSDFSDFSAPNISWDFTAGATTATGLTTAAPDGLPTVYTTGQSVTYPGAASAEKDQPLSGLGPFGENGIVVAYKGGNAIFIKGVPAGTTVTCPEFFPKALKDTSPHTQIRP